MEHEKDCTSKCRSSVHAKQILSCVPAASSSQIRAYSVWLCHNFAVVTDELGRNLLHVASACGKWEVVEWLLKHCSVDVDVKDSESGWTALHRSFFYGQLVSAKVLCMYGANLKSTDHDGLTPLDVIMKDRLPYIEYIPSDPSEVYVWGSNFNYNLGLGNLQSRVVPEILEVFRKDFIDIKQVKICKFHSVFLSVNGKVYTCGHGLGGRLGQENEGISLVPSLIKGLGSQACLEIAAGQDHLLLLFEGGQVWSCGLNTYHQLGHIPPVDQILVPKPLSLKFLKGKDVVGIRAAHFHSVIYTKDCVYTFGLNAGQLGHPRGDRTQISPRQVSALYNENWHLTHVEASDGATVCATSRGDIYVLHEYQIRKIASRQLEISKLSVVGGHLDSRCDVSKVREGGGVELRVVLLTKSGKVYLWKQTDPYLRRCLFSLQKELIISDIHINHYTIGMITYDNEAYMGQITKFKGQRSAPVTATSHAPSIFNSRPSSGLTVLLDTYDCNIIKVEKLPNIYRGTSITSDSKGRNFAVLQSNPKMGVVEIPMISNSQMLQDFSRLFLESNADDDFHDVVIQVGSRKFAAHRYVLASRSDYFKKQFAEDNNKNLIKIENMKPEAFEQLLKFMYSNHCEFLTPGYEVKWGIEKETGKKKKPGSKISKKGNAISLLQEASRRVGLLRLAKRLDGVSLNNGKITIPEASPLPPMSFNRHSLSNLSDVNLLSSDGSVFHCHKCILIARLDYFHSMLSTCWAENSKLGHLSLPISTPLMEAVIDYLYTDCPNKVLDSEDTEFLCHLLMITDQLLMTRFKEICEVSLVKLITLKNAAELLELSHVCNAQQLKRTCMQFIAINLAAIIEAKGLECLSDEVIQELTAYYRSLVPSMHRRRVSFSSSPLQEDLQFIEKQFPISSSRSFVRNKLETHEVKTKSRRRCNSIRSDMKDLSFEDTQHSVSCTSEKDIVLDILIPELQDLKMKKEIVPPLKEVQQEILLSEKSQLCKPGQWIMRPPGVDQLLTLDKIMLEEEKKVTLLHKKLSSNDMKPIPHLSQKEKKNLEISKNRSGDLFIPCTPPSKSSCPWTKLPEQSPPSPSFWDAVAKKEFPPSALNKEFSSPPNSISEVNSQTNCNFSTSSENSQNIMISFSEIQKDEEKKQRRADNIIIKPLHIINIEEQAIEELSELYNARDNHREKVTVSRILPEELASPVWKKRK